MAAPKEERTVEIIVNGQRANASLKEMEAAASVLNSQFRKMAADDPGRAKLIADLRGMRERIGEVKQEVVAVTETTGHMKQAFANAFAFLVGGGIEAAIGKIFELGKSIFDTTAKFQTYESVMTNALGDKSKAQQAMRDIQQMAAKTPFSVDELTGSFIKFVNRGLTPSMAEMTKMADIAASQGKSFDQLTEAVLDAAGGEFERLKEFGIKASKSGDQVSLSFKGVNQVVKNTPEAINGAIMAFGTMKGVAGSTAAISATLEGQLSNLGDSADQLKIKMGEGLKPAFTLILTLFGRFIDWIGRFLEAASPLKSMFAEIGAIVLDFYHEIGDVLASLGLFSDKTDTVKWAIEALKLVLTLLLIPLKAAFLAAKGMVDVFIDWYNKSELLRGILGGLGAVVVQLFTTIKDDAIKILSGVGDILVGIFTLDKDKIIAGFKSALAATADVMLEGGNKAYKAWQTGFDANKDNHITRTVRVKTETSEEPGQSGVDLKSDKAVDAAGDKKAAAEALKKRLAEIEAWKHHQEMLLSLEQAAVIARHDERGAELAAINLDSRRKIVALQAAAKEEIAKLTGTAQEKRARLLDIEQQLGADVAIVKAEALDKQAAQAEKYLQEDYKRQQDYINDQIDLIEDEATRRQAAFDTMLDAGLTSQRAADQAKYQARQAAFKAELALIEGSLGKESAAYKKVNAAMLKDQTDNDKKDLANREKATKAKQALQKLEMQTASDVLGFALQLLDQDADARKKHHGLYVALAAAKIIVDGTKEVAQIWEYAAENPANGTTFGVAGAIVGGIQTALAVGRTAIALSQVFKTESAGGGGSYAQGGATGTGAGLAVSPWGQLMAMSGMAIGGDGRLRDNSGFAVAGIVHEDEYVIPKWQRADPQVAAVEQWLEARRLRGFADGGPTSSGSSGATLPLAAASPVTDGERTYAVQTQMLQALLVMGQQLADVKTWQRDLNVRLDLRATQSGIDTLKQVEYNSAIRSKA